MEDLTSPVKGLYFSEPNLYFVPSSPDDWTKIDLESLEFGKHKDDSCSETLAEVQAKCQPRSKSKRRRTKDGDPGSQHRACSLFASSWWFPVSKLLCIVQSHTMRHGSKVTP